MRIKNTEGRYGIVAIGFHWLMAILIIGLLAMGLYMAQLPIRHTKLKLYGWHKECGILVLGLVMLRLVWRLLNVNPRLSLPFLEKLAAHMVHWALYAFMFAMPLTGWLMTSAAGFPPSFFGLFVLPNLVAPNEELRHLFGEIHQWLGYGLIALIVLHTCAALKHHFIDKDDILKRMLS